MCTLARLCLVDFLLPLQYDVDRIQGLGGHVPAARIHLLHFVGDILWLLKSTLGNKQGKSVNSECLQSTYTLHW